MDIDSITINEASTEDSTCSKFFPFSKYNLFSFGDVVQSNIDWEGRGAIGGNATFYNFEIGKGIVPKPAPNVDKTLVVGGNLKWYGGVNYAGNTIMTPNGTYTAKNVIYSNTSLHQPLREDPLPIDFKSAYNYSSCLSNKLSTTKSEGNTTILNCHGTIELVGDSPKVNIFNINPNQIAMLENIVGGSDTPNSLSSIHGITIVAPKGSTNIINVSGSYVKFGNYSILRNTNVPNPFPTADNRSCNILNSGCTPTATEKEKLLWNFYGKNPTIVMSNISLSGSILAPNGNLKAVGGNIEGNVVVNSFKPYQNNLKYHTELHNFQFSGCIPKLDCISTSTSSSESISESISKSISESISKSTSESISESVSISISKSTSESISESVSISISKSTSESISESVSISISKSLSGSISLLSESASISISESISLLSESTSISISESISLLSESVSESISESISLLSESTSESISESISLLSESASESISESISLLSESTSMSISESISLLSESVSESISESISLLSESVSESISESISLLSESTSESISESISLLSESASISLSESISLLSESASESISESISLLSESTSMSISESISLLSESVSESISESISLLSESASISISESISLLSESASISISESISASVSKSTSASISESISASVSSSISESTTESISGSITSFCCCSCIDGTVWCDCNCNCRYDCNEKPIACVMVLLCNPKNGCVFKKTYTNQYGYYYFSNVCPGNYNIMFYINESCYFCSDNIIIYPNQCSETVNMGLYKSY